MLFMHILKFIYVQNLHEVPSVDCLFFLNSRCPPNKQLKHMQNIRASNLISGK